MAVGVLDSQRSSCSGLRAALTPDERLRAATMHHYTGLIGTSVSGVFLHLITIVNLVILIGFLGVFMRPGVYDDVELDEQLNNRGLLNPAAVPAALRDFATASADVSTRDLRSRRSCLTVARPTFGALGPTIVDNDYRYRL
jgi:hypothetical protein